MKTTVICPICNKEFSQINNAHLKRSHNLTTYQFKQLYPEVSLISEEVREKNKANSKTAQLHPNHGKASAERHIRIKQQYEENKKYCIACNIPIPYEIRVNNFCSQTCSCRYSNYIRNNNWPPKPPKLKIRQAYPRIDAAGPFTKIKRCKICNNWFVDTGTRHTCSYECAIHNRGGYRKNSSRVHRVVYKGVQMGSGAEALFASILDDHNIKWIKNDVVYYTFRYPSGKTGKYYPDFLLPEFKQWIEIKGKRYLREHDELRWASAQAIVIMSTELIDKHHTIQRILAECTGFEPV